MLVKPERFKNTDAGFNQRGLTPSFRNYDKEYFTYSFITFEINMHVFNKKKIK